MNGERAARLQKNEALFRSVNERMKELTDELRLDVATSADGTLEEYVCECADAECMERVSLSGDEYERVRSNASWFAVVPGHVALEIERVIDETERFWMLEKHPGERAISQATDIRT